MGSVYRCLVIENDPDDDPRRLGEWLTGAGLLLDVVQVHRDEPVPAELDGYAALLVLGGEQHAYPGPDGSRDAPWLVDLERLLRKAVRGGLPTLGVCLGAQLLATAHAGTVAKAAAGPTLGLSLVAKRDAAELDPLFAAVPMLPDVVAWHHDEVTELPLGAVLLAASTGCPNQAFRLGSAAWGIQFHVECDVEMISRWASSNARLLSELGTSAAEVVAQAESRMDDLFEAWQPFAYRFASLARGEASRLGAGRELPLVRR